MQIRPRREIELTEYGGEGVIVLEPLTFSRKNQWKNNIGKATHFAPVGNGKDVRVESQDIGDLMLYKVLAYMTDAPFKLNSLESFIGFMDRLDSRNYGASDKLMDRLNSEIDSMKDDSPLQVSADAEKPSSE